MSIAQAGKEVIHARATLLAELCLEVVERLVRWPTAHNQVFEYDPIVRPDPAMTTPRVFISLRTRNILVGTQLIPVEAYRMSFLFRGHQRLGFFLPKIYAEPTYLRRIMTDPLIHSFQAMLCHQPPSNTLMVSCAYAMHVQMRRLLSSLRTQHFQVEYPEPNGEALTYRVQLGTIIIRPFGRHHVNLKIRIHEGYELDFTLSRRRELPQSPEHLGQILLDAYPQ